MHADLETEFTQILAFKQRAPLDLTTSEKARVAIQQ